MKKQKLITFLENLGLSALEAKIYATLIQNGPIGVSDLADILGIKRTRTYLHINSLIEKGLVTKIIRDAKQQEVKVVNPKENLGQLINQKVHVIEKVKSDLPDILEIINTNTSPSLSIAAVEMHYYKGEQGVKKIYEEAMQAKEVRIYAKVEENEKLFSDNVSFFNQAFKKNKKLKVFEILYDSLSASRDAEQIRLHHNNYLYKFMPKSLKLTSEDILMYDGKVAILNYKGNAVSIVLSSLDYYNNSKALFDYIWETIPQQSL